MTAVDKMYGRWGNYIPTDIRKQFEDDCLEAEKQIAELERFMDKHFLWALFEYSKKH